MIKELWRRRITLLAIPSGVRLTPWKVCLSLRLLILAAAGWTGLTLLVVFFGLRLVDYGWLRADNHSLRARLASLSGEMAQTRAEFEAAREADKEIRALLRLSTPSAQKGMPAELPAATASGSGGPAPADRRALLQSFLNAPAPAGMDPLRRSLDDLRRMSHDRVASCQEIAAHLAWRRRLLQALPSGWPAQGRITSPYGRRLSPISADGESEDQEFHPGLDIASVQGSPIRATADGTVVRARWSGGYGRLVMLRHDLGYATLYGHASHLLVKEGDLVKRGQVIAAMGSTGRSTGSHLHYEVWFNGKTVNPARFLKD